MPDDKVKTVKPQLPEKEEGDDQTDGNEVSVDTIEIAHEGLTIDDPEVE